ncbi:hypothetical protein ACFE04_019430 [Oxalis oulophora]
MQECTRVHSPGLVSSCLASYLLHSEYVVMPAVHAHQVSTRRQMRECTGVHSNRLASSHLALYRLHLDLVFYACSTLSSSDGEYRRMRECTEAHSDRLASSRIALYRLHLDESVQATFVLSRLVIKFAICLAICSDGESVLEALGECQRRRVDETMRVHL